MCDAIGINDRQFVRLDVFRLSKSKERDSCVVLFITKEEGVDKWQESMTK